MTTFYDEIGGEETITADRRRASTRRGRGRGAAPALPRGGPRPGRGAVPAVPHAVLGRPHDVLRPRGHPRLRMRHAPFAVTPDAKDHWLQHFRAGARRGRPAAGAGRAVLGLRHPRRAVHGQLVRVTLSPGDPVARRLRGRLGAEPTGSRWSRKTIRPPSARASTSSPSRISDSNVTDVVPTRDDPGPAVVGLGAEEDRAPVVDVGLRDDEVVRPLAQRLGRWRR